MWFTQSRVVRKPLGAVPIFARSIYGGEFERIRPEFPSPKPSVYRNGRPLNRAARTMYGNTATVISAAGAAPE